MRVAPVTLEGRVIRLEPLSLGHLDGLAAVCIDPGIWRWMSITVETRDDMRRYVGAALIARDEGRELPFATVERSTGRVVGSTRYLNIEPAHRRLEIGWTWIAPAWQRSAVNSEAKLLQLRHAFEVLGARRVEFKTDSLNAPSRRALARIGAVEEGTLRNHMLMPGGRMRHSVYFSVTDAERPAVRSRLEAGLANGASGAAEG
jgi:RimJ/RimL family protein N-acetyltransferase